MIQPDPILLSLASGPPDHRPAMSAMPKAPRPGLDRSFDRLSEDQFLPQRPDTGRNLFSRRRVTQLDVAQPDVVMPFDLPPDRDHTKTGCPMMTLQQIHCIPRQTMLYRRASAQPWLHPYGVKLCPVSKVQRAEHRTGVVFSDRSVYVFWSNADLPDSQSWPAAPENHSFQKYYGSQTTLLVPRKKVIPSW